MVLTSKPKTLHTSKDDEQQSFSLSRGLVHSVKKKVQDGEISRAANILTSAGVAPESDATVKLLQNKHPPRKHSIDSDQLHRPIDCTPLQINQALLSKTLKYCPNGSGPGRDGWRFQYLKLLLESQFYLELLLTTCNSLLAGNISDSTAQALAEAKLIALEKNENDIRPITVGNCIRRLVAKAACSQRKKEIADYLAPHQYGVSTPGGAEMMIHLIQFCHLSHPDWVILKLDARNAFNSVSRKIILSEVSNNFPDLFPFVSKCYAQPSQLTTRLYQSNCYISSEEGVQQGDPMGPFLFALVLQPLLVKINCNDSGTLTPSYLDDITVIGPKDEVISLYKELKDDLLSIGLELTEKKCEAFALHGISDWNLEIPVKPEGFEVLGTPVGSDSYVERCCLAKFEKKSNYYLDFHNLKMLR